MSASAVKVSEADSLFPKLEVKSLPVLVEIPSVELVTSTETVQLEANATVPPEREIEVPPMDATLGFPRPRARALVVMSSWFQNPDLPLRGLRS